MVNLLARDDFCRLINLRIYNMHFFNVFNLLCGTYFFIKKI